MSDPTIEDIQARIKHRIAINRLDTQTLRDERNWLDVMALDLEELRETRKQDPQALRTFYNLIAKGA